MIHIASLPEQLRLFFIGMKNAKQETDSIFIFPKERCLLFTMNLHFFIIREYVSPNEISLHRSTYKNHATFIRSLHKMWQIQLSCCIVFIIVTSDLAYKSIFDKILQLAAIRKFYAYLLSEMTTMQRILKILVAACSREQVNAAELLSVCSRHRR